VSCSALLPSGGRLAITANGVGAGDAVFLDELFLDNITQYNLYKKLNLKRSSIVKRSSMRMVDNRTTVLLILSQDVLDRARVVAGKATITLKLPVSLQIVLRSLIEEGLKRDGHPAFLANIEGQARAVRHKRSMARRARAEEQRRNPQSGSPRGRGK